MEASPALISEKSIKVFGKHNVLSEAELYSRYEIFLEAYIKQINIEALTMIEMAKTQILPAAIKYIGELAFSYNQAVKTGIDLDKTAQHELLIEISNLTACFKRGIKVLEDTQKYAANMDGSSYDKAEYYKNEVLNAMDELRLYGDKLETLIPTDLWPIPTYGELLFYI